MNRLRFSILLLSFSISAMAQTAKKDTIWERYDAPAVTITASRYLQSAAQARIPVNIIDYRDISTSMPQTLGDVFITQPGLDRVTAGPWSEKPVIRGLSTSQVLTLVDGLRLNVLRGYGQHAPLVDPSQLDRIEVVRGPGSVQYGSDAVGGVINLITRQPVFSNHGWRWSPSLSLATSSANNQFAQTVELQGASPSTALLLRVQHRKAGDMDTPMGKLINTAFQGLSFDAKARQRLKPGHELRADVQIQRFDNVGVPINANATEAEFKAYDRTLTTVGYHYENSKSTLVSASVKAYYQKGYRHFKAFVANVPKGPLFANNELEARRHADTGGFQSQIRLLWNAHHLTLAGMDAFREDDDTKRRSDAFISNAAGTVVKDPPASFVPPTPQSRRLGMGAFVEHEWSLDRLTFTGGLRYDRCHSEADAEAGTLVSDRDMQVDEGDFSANFGILSRISSQISLLAHLGRAFSAPTLQERFFLGTAQVGYLYGNPELNSEKAFNLDIGLRWNSESISAELAVFRNSIQDYIMMSPVNAANDTLKYDNVGKALLQGSELTITWHPAPMLTLALNGALVRGEDTETDESLYQIPPFRASFGMTLRAPNNKGWIKNTVQYSDAQTEVAMNEQPSAGYWLWHINGQIGLNSSVDWGCTTSLTFSVCNVLNTSYRDHLASVQWWDGMGRNISIGINISK